MEKTAVLHGPPLNKKLH